MNALERTEKQAWAKDTTWALDAWDVCHALRIAMETLAEQTSQNRLFATAYEDPENGIWSPGPLARIRREVADQQEALLARIHEALEVVDE